MHANRTHTTPPSSPAAVHVHRRPITAIAALLACAIVACTMIHAIAALALRTPAVAPLHDPIVHTNPIYDQDIVVL